MNRAPANSGPSDNGNSAATRSQGTSNGQTFNRQQGSSNTRSLNTGNMDRRNVDRGNANAGGQSRTSYYRGGGNINRSNSAFFGNTGGFNNAYVGRNGFNNYGGYGLGYGYGGYNGYGGLGLGYGYGGLGYGFLPFLGGLGLGYGLGGLGYSGYGGAADGASGGTTAIVDDSQPVRTDADQAAAQVPTNPPTSLGTDYVMLGENDFRAGQYPEAIGAFRHAMVDEPNNAGLMLMISQALFQTGQWTQAAAATELAMGALPEDNWGTVAQHYTQLYGNIKDYTSQLKNLENAVKEKPNDPALRFLLGFHYGYLNYPQQAVRELGKAVELEGRDPAARRLHDLFAAKTGAQQVGAVPKGLRESNSNTNTPDANAPHTNLPARPADVGAVTPTSPPTTSPPPQE
jgi:Flp pilus assembly protein TadD